MKEPMRIRQGHVLDELAELPEGSVQCIVTSPPYWGLRDYSRCPCTIRDKAKAWFDFETQTWFVPNPDEEENRKEPDPACPTCHGTGRVEGLVQVWGAKEEKCEHEWGKETRTKHEEFQHGFKGSLDENPNPRDTGGLRPVARRAARRLRPGGGAG